MTEREYLEMLKQELEPSEETKLQLQETIQEIRDMSAAGSEQETERSRKMKRRHLLVVSAAAVLTLGLVVTAFAQIQRSEDLFGKLFGTDGRTSTERETVEQVQTDEDGNVIKISKTEKPANEYTDLNEEIAGELDEKVAAPDHVQVSAGGTTLTLESFLSDGIIGIASMKVENPNGLDGICEVMTFKHGEEVVFAGEQSFEYEISTYDSSAYPGAVMSGPPEYITGVMPYDPDGSSDTIMYYSEIGCFRHPDQDPGEEMCLTFTEYDASWNTVVGEINELLEEHPFDPDMIDQETPDAEFLAEMQNLVPSHVIQGNEKIPFSVTYVEKKEKRSEETGMLQFVYSPISMSCVFYNILPEGVMFRPEMDTEVYYLGLEYEDGDVYTVISHHRDGENISNTNYIMQGLGDEREFSTYAFNRLVDWDTVAAVLVNEERIEMP